MLTKFPVVPMLALLALSASAEAQPPKPKPAAAPSTPNVAFGTKKVDIPQGETTEVKGKIPADLTGLWLVAEEHHLPNGPERVYPTLQLYQVDKSEKGAPEVHWLRFKPPPAVQAKLSKAQSEQKSWAPDKDDIDAITTALAAGRPRVDKKLRGQHHVVEASQLDAETKKSPGSKGAIFAIRSIFQPHDRPMFGQSYFVAKASKEELSGKVTMGAVSTGGRGIPVPVGTSGTFRWIKLTPPAVSPTPAATESTPGATAPAAVAPTPSAAPTAPKA